MKAQEMSLFVDDEKRDMESYVRELEDEGFKVVLKKICESRVKTMKRGAS